MMMKIFGIEKLVKLINIYDVAMWDNFGNEIATFVVMSTG